MLPRIANIKDADGPHEVEFRSADIDVRAILNELEGPVGWNEIFDWQGLERSTAVGPVQGFKDAASVVWWPIALIRDAHGAAPDLQWRFNWPRRYPPDEFGASPGARDGCRPPAGQTQEDRAVDRICLRARGRRQRKTSHG
jgi:hypothetical protein